MVIFAEPATNDVRDYAINKAIEHLPQLQQKLSSIGDQYQQVQQDILEIFVDRAQPHQLLQPTLLPNGERIPGLKVGHPRLQALGCFPANYRLSALRYDGKLQQEPLSQLDRLYQRRHCA